MRYSTRYRSTYYSSGSFPPGVKWLIIANVVMFLIAYFAGGTSLGRDLRLLELVPDTVVHNFTIWQLFTYLFLHGGVWHLLVNMFTLWSCFARVDGPSVPPKLRTSGKRLRNREVTRRGT